MVVQGDIEPCAWQVECRACTYASYQWNTYAAAYEALEHHIKERHGE